MNKQSSNPESPLYPWRLDTNDRYRDAVKIVIDLSTASLLLPVFFLRDFLQIPKEQPLSQSLNYIIYLSWICLVLAIFCGFVFYYFSAKWIKLSWGHDVGFLGMKMHDRFVERVLDVSFTGAITLFILGVILIAWFVVSFIPQS